MQAASAGSVSANVCAAQIMERRGDMDAAMKFWGKAARHGHPEGQYKLGKVGFALCQARQPMHNYCDMACELVPGLTQQLIKISLLNMLHLLS